MTKWQAKTINQREDLYRQLMNMDHGETYDVAEAAIEALKLAAVPVVIPVPAKTAKAKKAA